MFAELENFLTRLDPAELAAHFKERLQAVRRDAGRRVRECEKELAQNRKLLREWLERLDRYLLNPASSLYSEEVLAEKLGNMRGG